MTGKQPTPECPSRPPAPPTSPRRGLWHRIWSNWDQIYSRVTRAIAFFAGLGAFGWQVLDANDRRYWVMAAALGLMGFQFAKWADKGGGE